MGDSCAKANVLFSAIMQTKGAVPRMARKPLLEIWMKGGGVPVGLNRSNELRSGPEDPSMAKDNGLMNYNKAQAMLQQLV